jgi:hypothetical protein
VGAGGEDNICAVSMVQAMIDPSLMRQGFVMDLGRLLAVAGDRSVSVVCHAIATVAPCVDKGTKEEGVKAAEGGDNVQYSCHYTRYAILASQLQRQRQ